MSLSHSGHNRSLLWLYQSNASRREGGKKSVEGNIGTQLQTATDQRGGEQVETKIFNPLFLEQVVDAWLKRSARTGRHQDPNKLIPQSCLFNLAWWATKCPGISRCWCLLACYLHSCWLLEKSSVHSQKRCSGRLPTCRHSWQSVWWNVRGWPTSTNCNFRTITTSGWKIPQKVRGAVFISWVLQNP